MAVIWLLVGLLVGFLSGWAVHWVVARHGRLRTDGERSDVPAAETTTNSLEGGGAAPPAIASEPVPAAAEPLMVPPEPPAAPAQPATVAETDQPDLEAASRRLVEDLERRFGAGAAGPPPKRPRPDHDVS